MLKQTCVIANGLLEHPVIQEASQTQQLLQLPLTSLYCCIAMKVASQLQHPLAVTYAYADQHTEHNAACWTLTHEKCFQYPKVTVY